MISCHELPLNLWTSLSAKYTYTFITTTVDIESYEIKQKYLKQNKTHNKWWSENDIYTHVVHKTLHKKNTQICTVYESVMNYDNELHC